MRVFPYFRVRQSGAPNAHLVNISFQAGRDYHVAKLLTRGGSCSCNVTGGRGGSIVYGKLTILARANIGAQPGRQQRPLICLDRNIAVNANSISSAVWNNA